MKKLINNYKKWNPSFYAITYILLVALLLFMLQGFKLDNDFWFLINTGKTILKDGFINVEVFTIHNGFAFIPQQWLTDIIFYFIYNNLGVRGMYYLVLLCSIVTIFIFYKICFLVNNNTRRTTLITVLSFFFLAYSGALTTRPQLFDVSVFSLELFLLESYIEKNKQIYLYFIPLVSIFLINYHAAMWLMLFVLMIPYYVEYIILKWKKREVYSIKPLIIITIFSLIGGLINPYGLESLKYLINSYGISKINNLVIEMKPITIPSLRGKVFFMIIFLIFYSFYRNKSNNKIRHFFLFIGLVYLALSHYKGVMFFCTCVPLILGYNYRKKEDGSSSKLRLLDKSLFLASIIAVLAILIFAIPIKDGVEIRGFADYLDQNASFDIKLFTSYNDGAYMEYRGYKCYIDARAEVFLKKNNHVEDIFDEYYGLEIGKQNPKDFLEKYHFDYLLVEDDSYMLIYELNNNPQYEVVMSKKNDKSDVTRYLFKNNGVDVNEKNN